MATDTQGGLQQGNSEQKTAGRVLCGGRNTVHQRAQLRLSTVEGPDCAEASETVNGPVCGGKRDSNNVWRRVRLVVGGRVLEYSGHKRNTRETSLPQALTPACRPVPDNATIQ